MSFFALTFPEREFIVDLTVTNNMKRWFQQPPNFSEGRRYSRQFGLRDRLRYYRKIYCLPFLTLEDPV